MDDSKLEKAKRQIIINEGATVSIGVVVIIVSLSYFISGVENGVSANTDKVNSNTDRIERLESAIEKKFDKIEKKLESLGINSSEIKGYLKAYDDFRRKNKRNQ